MFFKQVKQKKRNHQQQVEKQQNPLSSDFFQNVEKIHSLYEDCSDVVFRSFLIGEKIKAEVIYIDGLVNVQELEASVLSPLIWNMDKESLDVSSWMKEKLSVAKVTEVKTVDECIQFISIGNPVLLVEGESQGFALGLAQFEKRSIAEPESEVVIKGPREGFIESIGVNLALVRRKIKSPNLKMRSMKIGRSTQTEVVMAYMKDLADETLVEEVYNRLSRIDIDGILDSQYIEELIGDAPSTPFPLIYSTERPDACAANLLDGRVSIFVDGSPFVMIAPATLLVLLQSSEDYYENWILGTAIRWLRYVYFAISFLLPSLYVAILSYHQEMVPTKLIMSMASSRENVPFPAVVEALIMEITFEALREAGARLPKQIGSSVSIVGALVIGQAAIQAGIVSPPMVIVVALTGIASFTIPAYNLGASLRLLRFPMMFLAGTLGLLGVMIGVLALLTHLCTLRTFGVPYLSPFAPLKISELKDALVRAPMWKLSTRPHLTGEYNQHRQGANQKPGPKQGGE
jgi:Bacillus/Clostridium GerA spore germination protein